jgi:hypothetical protein
MGPLGTYSCVVPPMSGCGSAMHVANITIGMSDQVIFSGDRKYPSTQEGLHACRFKDKPFSADYCCDFRVLIEQLGESFQKFNSDTLSH